MSPTSNPDHGEEAQPPRIRSASSRKHWMDAGLLFLLALGVRLWDLSFAPDVDEFHHILAAQSLLGEGNLTLAGGETPYTRGLLYTLLVAGVFALFGDSVEIARLPAILGAAVLVAVLYLWVRSIAGRIAGWVAALLLCTYPFGVYLTQVSRFYSLHTLFFLLGVIAVYRLVSEPPGTQRHRLALAALAVLAMLLAFHLQVSTVIGIAGLGLWLSLDRGAWGIRWMRNQSRPWLALAGLGGVLLVLASVVWLSGLPERALYLFQYADPWAFEERDNLRFYHRLLQGNYGPLWALFPVLVLGALYKNTRFGLLCLVLFGVTFLAHSLAAWKHPRYVFYVMPFFFAIVGVAISQAVPLVTAGCDRVLSRMRWERLGRSGPPVGIRKGALLGFTVITLGFGLLGMGAFSEFVRMMQPGPDPLDSPRPYRGKADWAAAQATLMELSDGAEVLISYSHLKPPYYLDRLDVILQRNHLYQDDEWQPEFTPQRQLLRPVISSPESMEGIVACHETGMVIGEQFGWGDPAGVPSETVLWIETHLERVDVPPEWRIPVFVWDGGVDLFADGERGPIDCRRFPVGRTVAGSR